MENILAAMDATQTRLFAGIHALSLARRISAKVTFLLVFPASPESPGSAFNHKNAAIVKKSVEALIEDARSDGIAVDYYAADGIDERELASFIQENKVTLLVVEYPAGPGDAGETSPNVLDKVLDKLRHRINCRIEVVNEKPKAIERKDKKRVAPISTDRGK